MTDIKEHMEVIGADGVHVGTVDKLEGNRIKLTKKDSGEGSHKGHHHYIDRGLVADVEGNKVRLSANRRCRRDDGRRKGLSQFVRLNVEARRFTPAGFAIWRDWPVAPALGPAVSV